MDRTIYNKTVEFFEALLQLLHPFMPFISENIYPPIETVLSKQINAELIEYSDKQMPRLLTVLVKKDKIFIGTERALGTDNQQQQMLKDLDHLKGFLNSVEKKLNNGKFVQN